MPTYRVKCKKCGNIFDKFAKIDDRLGIKCECGDDTEIQIVGIGLRTTMYGRENSPLFLEHMTYDEPVYVTTKSQLREACKKHNCISPILD